MRKCVLGAYASARYDSDLKDTQHGNEELRVRDIRIGSGTSCDCRHGTCIFKCRMFLFKSRMYLLHQVPYCYGHVRIKSS